MPITDKDSPTRIIAVSSGKGGVGKSTVSINLALAMAERSLNIGLLDADIYGSSLTNILNTREQLSASNANSLVPPTIHGIKCLSMSMLVENNQPIIWRGPMLHGILQQFLTEVDWGDIDYLLIDMPPGTGDVLLSLAELLPRMEVVLVTTPKRDARAVASRAAAASIKLKVKLQGIVENMSWFIGRDGTKYTLFGKGGGQKLADEYSVPLLAQIPLYYDPKNDSLKDDHTKSDHADSNHPGSDHVADSDDSEAKPIMLSAPLENEIADACKDAYRKLAEKVVAMKPSKIRKRELRLH